MTDLYRPWPHGEPEPPTEPVRAYSEEHAGKRFMREHWPTDGTWREVKVRWFGPDEPVTVVGAYNYPA